jgi:hypothetical protein
LPHVSVIIIIIIIIIIIPFMQGTHTYIPEKNHVSRVYSVAAILRVLLIVHIALSSILNSVVLPHQHFPQCVCCAQHSCLLLLLLLVVVVVVVVLSLLLVRYSENLLDLDFSYVVCPMTQYGKPSPQIRAYDAVTCRRAAELP